MAFDFKKEYKEFYMPKNRPEIVTVPKANYIAVRGKGNPNEIDGAYQQAISILYAVAYTLKIKDFDGLDKNSIILFEQIRTIDKQRLREYLGTLDRRFIHCADKALAISIGLAKKD